MPASMWNRTTPRNTGSTEGTGRPNTMVTSSGMRSMPRKRVRQWWPISRASDLGPGLSDQQLSTSALSKLATHQHRGSRTERGELWRGCDCGRSLGALLARERMAQEKMFSTCGQQPGCVGTVDAGLRQQLRQQGCTCSTAAVGRLDHDGPEQRMSFRKLIASEANRCPIRVEEDEKPLAGGGEILGREIGSAQS